MSNHSQPRTLSDRQIDWCRRNIKSFSEAWSSVQKADAHRLAVYEKLGVAPGSLSRRAA